MLRLQLINKGNKGVSSIPGGTLFLYNLSGGIQYGGIRQDKERDTGDG